MLKNNSVPDYTHLESVERLRKPELLVVVFSSAPYFQSELELLQVNAHFVAVGWCVFSIVMYHKTT